MMSGFNVCSSLKYVAPEAETNREVWLGRLWVILILLWKKEYVLIWQLQMQLNESKTLHLWKCNLNNTFKQSYPLLSLKTSCLYCFFYPSQGLCQTCFINCNLSSCLICFQFLAWSVTVKVLQLYSLLEKSWSQMLNSFLMKCRIIAKINCITPNLMNLSWYNSKPYMPSCWHPFILDQIGDQYLHA